MTSSSPAIATMRVIPIAGHDSMLLNLSGAHGPYFIRNLVILTDTAGHTGVGEVPGGERIRQTLEDARTLIIGQTIGAYNAILNSIRAQFADRDSGGRGLQTSTTASPSTRSPQSKPLCSTYSVNFSAFPLRLFSAKASSAKQSKRWAISSISGIAARRISRTPTAENAKDDWLWLRSEAALYARCRRTPRRSCAIALTVSATSS